jgi:hypothetical protein
MSLSSLIVQRGVATMRQVEEALARQVIYGGDLVTNLLEVARVDEAVLTRLLAETSRLAAAPAGELPRAVDRVRALVPPELAAERLIVPIEARGNTLVLAVAERIPPEVEEQLAFALGMSIEQRAAPSVRVRQAIADAYGVPLDRRMLRLIALLSGQTPVAGSMPPPLGAAPYVLEPPRPPSGPPSRGGRSATNPPFIPSAHPAVGPSTTAAPGRRTTSTSFPAGRVPAEVASPPDRSAPDGVAPAVESETPSTPVIGERQAGLLQRNVTLSTRPTRRRRGPLTLEGASRDAEEASDRDALLELFFDYARQFFDYSALFLVHGDIAEGRDAFGNGAPRERVLGIGIPLDLPSLVSSARDKRIPVVARASADGLDGVLLADLQRGRDVEIVVLPLVVRTRAVAVLLGDCGDAGIDRANIRQVSTFAEVVANAFERIIVRRKLAGFIAGSRESPIGRVDATAVVAKPRSAAPGPVAAVSPSLPPAGSVASRVFAPMGLPTPPPPANIAVVRKISGPPIPREDPQTLTAVRIVRARALTDPAPPERGASSSPDVTSHLEDLEDSSALFDELGWETPAETVIAAPMPSSAIAIPPHLPVGSSRVPPEKLPSVIVELDRDLAAIVDRVIAGEADESAEGELLRQGQRAMQVIMSRFPGPVTFERARIATVPSPPRPSECGPVLRLVAHERRVALPFVIERLEDADPETRGWATHLLCELPYPEAIPHLLPRLRDVDASTRASAIHALVSIARTSRDAVRDALLGLTRSVDAEQRAAAMPVVAELREAALVPELVHALGDGYEQVVVAANIALVKVTGQDFGEDARGWLRWWEQNARRNRVEWMIDALTHDVSEIRRAAGDELRALSREYFGYSSDLPPRDRERAQQRYRDWWITEGRTRFHRS